MHPLLRRGWLAALLLAPLLPLRAETTVDDQGKFAVDIPLPVSRSSQDTDTALGKIKVFILTHDAGTSAYIVGYNDYPAGSISKTDPGKSFDGWASGQAGGMHGTLRSVTVHQLGELAGREAFIDIKEPQPLVARSRAYVIGDRLYQIMYLGPPGTENTAEVLKFLDSLRLLR